MPKPSPTVDYYMRNSGMYMLAPSTTTSSSSSFFLLFLLLFFFHDFIGHSLLDNPIVWQNQSWDPRRPLLTHVWFVCTVNGLRPQSLGCYYKGYRLCLEGFKHRDFQMAQNNFLFYNEKFKMNIILLSPIVNVCVFFQNYGWNKCPLVNIPFSKS